MKKRSKTQIASTYALALYEVAESKKAVALVKKDVSLLLDEINTVKDFIKYFSNPIWEIASKKEALKEIATKLKLSSETLNCLDVIADNNRFAEIDLILQEFKHIANQKAGIEEVLVKSVQPLSAEQEKKLSANLENMLGKKVLINYEISPEILGGLQIKFGSNMIDDTINSKLNRLEQIMKGGQ